MKKILNLVMVLSTLIFMQSCGYETVDPGHRGVEISYGGETNMNKVYGEGLDWGFHWFFDEIVQYDVREHTLERNYSFNDKNDMKTDVKIALDYNLAPKTVNFIHSTIADIEVKIETSLSSAAKEVVPQYAAVDLNKNKRAEAEQKLKEILEVEFPEFYVEFKRVRFTDIEIPAGISRLAEETAVQIGQNELATKKEAEQISLALAKVATAQGNYDAGILDAKTQALLAAPKILALREVEVEMQWAKTGKSRYGSNNIFGSDAAAVIRGLK